jgi:hypothetical protein
MDNYSLIRLVSREDAKETRRLVRFLLNNLPDFPLEFYAAVKDYRDGLDFVAFCRDALSPVWKTIPPDDRQKIDITLICVRLEMLDRLYLWEEYDKYFQETYSKHPGYQCVYKKSALHLKIDRAGPYLLGEDKDHIYVHFLYLLLPRFEAIHTYLKRFPAGSRKRNKLSPPPVPSPAALEAGFLKMQKRFNTLLGIDENIIEKYREAP